MVGGGGGGQVPAATPSPELGCSDRSCEEPSVPSPGPWEQDQGGCPREGSGPSSRAGCQLCTEPRAPTTARNPQLLLTLQEREQGRGWAPPGEQGPGGGVNEVPGEQVEEMAPQQPCAPYGRSGRHLLNAQPNSLGPAPEAPLLLGSPAATLPRWAALRHVAATASSRTVGAGTHPGRAGRPQAAPHASDGRPAANSHLPRCRLT